MESDSGASETPAVPAELTGPLPRRARLTVNGVLTVLAAAVLLFFAAYSSLNLRAHIMRQRQQEVALRRSGSETTGEIKRVWIPDQMSVHWVSYAFAVNGASFKGEARVPKQLLETIEGSQTLPVRYLPGNPAVNHPAAWNGSPRWNWEWIAIPVILAAALGAWMLLLLWRQRQLVAQGTPVQAVVTKCSRASGGYRVNYEFRVGGGMVTKGAGLCDEEQDIGAKIWVLHWPQNLQRSRPYPLPGFRVVLPRV